MTEARRRLARLIVPGWRGGTMASLRRLLEGCPAAGLLILRHGSLAETRRFVRALPAGLLVALDVEEGLGQRFPLESERFPSAMAAGETGDVGLAFRMGRAIGLESRAFGVHWAFAPVVDVNSDPMNPIINVRAFGEDPVRVGRMGAAFVRGCQSAGVLACAKHFPGHGATRTDSHSRLPVVGVSRAGAWRRELAPFRDAVRAGVASVMTAHAAFPAFDGRMPATLSRVLVDGVLRGELGFRGLVVTDSLGMGGIARGHDPVEAGLRSLLAGCDVLLDPPDPVRLLDRLERAFESGELPPEVVEAALARQEAARRRLGAGRPEADPAGYGRRTRDAIAGQSLRVLRGSVPARALREGPSRWVVVDDGAAPGAVRELRARVRRRFPRARWAGRAPVAVVAVFSRVRISKDRIRVPREAVRRAVRAASGSREVLAVLLGSPYVERDLPKGWAVLAAWSDAPASIRAAVDALKPR